MNEVLSYEINRLEKAFECIQRDTPILKLVANAFKEVMVSRVILKARLSDRDIHIPPIEYSKFAEGQPWLTKEVITSLIDPWGESVESTMLSLVEAFPSIEAEAVRLWKALKAGEVDLKYCIGTLVKMREEGIIKIASYLGFQPIVLKFILGQMLKPFVEQRTENLRIVIKNIPWHQGYCPICGAFPELSFLEGDDEQRWLRCSLCGYHWRFGMMACPHCGDKNAGRELIHVVGFEYEWVELCLSCHRYIVGIDLRKQKEVIADVAAIGMIHLDIIAQRKGFLPTAECAWNMVPPSN
jgi:FdhE protein